MRNANVMLIINKDNSKDKLIHFNVKDNYFPLWNVDNKLEALILLPFVSLFMEGLIDNLSLQKYNKYVIYIYAIYTMWDISSCFTYMCA